MHIPLRNPIKYIGSPRWTLGVFIVWSLLGSLSRERHVYSVSSGKVLSHNNCLSKSSTLPQDNPFPHRLRKKPPFTGSTSYPSHFSSLIFCLVLPCFHEKFSKNSQISGSLELLYSSSPSWPFCYSCISFVFIGNTS